jgi:hypothetical protein
MFGVGGREPPGRNQRFGKLAKPGPRAHCTRTTAWSRWRRRVRRRRQSCLLGLPSMVVRSWFDAPKAVCGSGAGRTGGRGPRPPTPIRKPVGQGTGGRLQPFCHSSHPPCSCYSSLPVRQSSFSRLCSTKPRTRFEKINRPLSPEPDSSGLVSNHGGSGGMAAWLVMDSGQ